MERRHRSRGNGWLQMRVRQVGDISSCPHALAMLTACFPPNHAARRLPEEARLPSRTPECSCWRNFEKGRSTAS
jgi:hypothetical protein